LFYFRLSPDGGWCIELRLQYGYHVRVIVRRHQKTVASRACKLLWICRVAAHESCFERSVGGILLKKIYASFGALHRIERYFAHSLAVTLPEACVRGNIWKHPAEDHKALLSYTHDDDLFILGCDSSRAARLQNSTGPVCSSTTHILCNRKPRVPRHER
jgi:hypothetical protein